MMNSDASVVSINATSGGLKIDYDPNWDDQQLYIHGVLNTAYSSSAGQSVAAVLEDVSAGNQGNENLMGVWYSGPGNVDGNKNWFSMTIGQNSDGLLDVTDVDTSAEMTIKYSVVAQTQWILVLKFEDV